MNMDKANSPATAAAEDLAEQLARDQVVMSGPVYAEAVHIWNGAVDHRPALVVRSRTAMDVQRSIMAAHRHGLPLSVRGGGHDWAGRALRDGGLVVDLSGMRQVVVDPEERIAAIGGGATASDVITAAAPHRLVAATGTVGSVGMAGLTLGGGYGPLNGVFGLTLDNLLGAEVVLADGRIVQTDEATERELFWSIRGGGGNFGVVTSMRVRLHPLDRLLAGFIIYPWSEAASVFTQVDAVLAEAPDELTVQTGLLTGPDGSPVLFLSPAWAGDLEKGQEHIERLQGLGTVLLSQVAPMTYPEMLGLFDAYVVTGRHYSIRTRTVTGFTPDVIAALVEAGSSLTSPFTGIAIHHFHGASTRIPADGTAFGIREPHFVIEIVAAWEDHAADRHVAWAENLSRALAPHAVPGGYPNLLGSDAWDQIAHAFGGNAARLRAAKTQIDPEGMFSAIPLPAAAE